MSQTILSDAHAVILAAFDDLDLTDDLRGFITGGGKAILLGETGEEYYSRQMTPERIARESHAVVRDFVGRAEALAGPLLVAADQELGGVERFGALLPHLPTLDEAKTMDPATLAQRCAATAAGARDIGINLFLAPVADLSDTVNPWLKGRTLSDDAPTVDRLCRAFIAGTQQAGVSATLKHFPGYKGLTSHPYEARSVLETAGDELAASMALFRSLVATGVDLVMVGPAPVREIDGEEPMASSARAIEILRKDLGFEGVIVTSNMDIIATMRDRSVEETAVRCIAAGSDLLLLPRGPLLHTMPAALAQAVARGDLPAERLAQSAARVRELAARRGGAAASAR